MIVFDRRGRMDQGPGLSSPETLIPAEEGDLESTLGVPGYTEGRAGPARRESHKLASTHHQWLAHILLCPWWDGASNGPKIDEALSSFIKYSFDSERDASWPVVKDCLFTVVYLHLGLPMQGKGTTRIVQSLGSGCIKT